MKRIFSFLLAVVLVLSFSLMAMPTLASSSPVWHTADQQTNSGNTTAGSVAKPSNLTEGNLVILIIVKQNSLNTTDLGIIPPDGFNLIRYEHDSAATARPEVLAYWKIATDSEPATYNFTVEHDDPQWKAIAGRVTGHCPTTPTGKHSGTHSGDTTVTSLAIPGITTGKDNVLLVGAVVARGDAVAPTNFTKPATMDDLWAIGGSGSGSDGAPGTGGGEEAFVTQGSTETRTFNWTGASHAAGLMFEILPAAYALTMAVAPTGSGNATDLTNASPYAEGTVVNITAAAAPGYRFGNWAATAGEFGNVTAAETIFTMPAQNVTVTANFAEVPLPQVTTQAATNITSYSAIVNMSYTVGDFSPVEMRFACKRSTDPAWFYTIWVSRTADGTYNEVLTGLALQTEYEFKAQLKYNGIVIEGATRRFTTGASIGFYDLFCFIATAAYGTPTVEQIDVLREFRDVVLLESAAGSQLVALYYRFSPPIADFIARSDLLRTLVRELLVDPVVWMVEATGGIWRKG